MPAPTLSISAWAIRICRRRSMSSTSSRRRSASRAPTAIRPPRALPACAAPRRPITTRRFGVKLNPDTQIVATLGSKEGFANVAQAITAPGDVVLVPDPSYPIHAFGFLMAGGVIRSVPSEPTPDFFTRSSARSSIRSRSRSRWWSAIRPTRRPSSPISTSTSDLVAFAKKHEIFISVRSRLCGSLFRQQSAAVGAAGAGRDGHDGRIHLDVEDVFDAGLAHGLCGRQRAHHRGAGAGEVLSRLRRVHAGAGCGDRGAQRPGRLHPEMRDIYRRRRDVLVESFGRAGWDVPPPTGVDVRLVADPGTVPRPSAASNSAKLLVEKAEVAVSPGTGFRRTRRRLRAYRAG